MELVLSFHRHVSVSSRSQTQIAGLAQQMPYPLSISWAHIKVDPTKGRPKTEVRLLGLHYQATLWKQSLTTQPRTRLETLQSSN